MESVQVALRIRPLLENEIIMGCQKCIDRIPNEPQVRVGKANTSYTFNYVFDEFEGQNKVYDVAIKKLTEKLFEGYNLTILAYGQTGSGKTFTMGTNYSGTGEMGVIPRAVYEIFDTVKTLENYTFSVSVTFLELYNESLYDLLANKTRECSVVDLREINNEICIPGLTEVEVTDPVTTLEKLNEGSLGRTVGATAMNAQSSRSHAIFTINIRIIPKNNPSGVMTSSFRLVDLAGSERSKKTGTTGDRFKEGVNINKGLLVLGNVISQLGEGNQNFVSYRDSKLTRLLQDSLGGNSVTLMIACVSPADYNQDETMSTLRYADRVKRIKNKPVVNQDPITAEICRLKKENEELRLKIIHNSDCPPNHKFLQLELEEAQNKLRQFNDALTETLWSNAKMYEKAVMAEQFNENIKEKLEELSKLSAVINETQNNESNNELLSELSSKIKQVQGEYTKAGKELLKHEVQTEQEPDEDNNEGPSPTKQEYILSQAKINKEILTLNQNLMWKEELIATYYESTDSKLDVQNASLIVEDLKKQITELQQEKDVLLAQLSSSSSVSSKIAEQRRKRLQELEPKVAALMKKVSDQERIIKMKANSEEKIKNLKNDVMAMKKMKVRLIQQMKMGNCKFQSWKAAKNKEMLALKNQNIKNQNNLKKMEQIHSRQQIVLKRKLEAAAAANKRLVAALERQKSAKSNKRLRGSATNLIKEKINEELEMVESTFQAQKSLENLMQERADLTKEFTDVKARLDNPCTTEKEKLKLNEEKKQLTEELALRNTEIADLQQKLLDIIHEDLNFTNWDILHNMEDAKVALSYLYLLLTEKMKDIITKDQAFSDLWEQYDSSQKEVDTVKRQLEEVRNNSMHTTQKSDKHSDAKNKTRKDDRNQFEVADEESLRAFDDSLEVDCDNLDNDPDWTKTPLYKKLQTLKSKRNNQQSNRCTCSSQCDRKCACKKGRKSCKENCSCDFNSCINKENASHDKEEMNDNTNNKRNSQVFPDLLGDIHPKRKKIYFQDP
ncbi:chromosome-associated kinesin KIF4-like [Rhodnius prolixus]|uniref:chromosome-associated kinesin KIF4-like n=1 Tax=Rhodnius prolixus TaxID=13249 RepID=UPI003D18F81F